MGFLLTASISASVFSTGIVNYMGKKECRTKGDSYLYNSMSYIVCILIFLALTFMGEVSRFSAGIGILYGIMIAISGGYTMLAYGAGPMHITVLILSSSMIIPAMSGVLFFNEPFSVIKLIGIIFLLFFIYLSVNKTADETKVNKKWLLFCTIAFFATGMIGILQKVHQGSVHKDETGVFLLAAFICSFIYSTVMSKKSGTEMKVTRKIGTFSVVSGICIFVMHYINLRLSGILPSQLFFPLVNAGPMILNIIISVVFFKERITKRQLIGIIGGIASLGCMCMFD